MKGNKTKEGEGEKTGVEKKGEGMREERRKRREEERNGEKGRGWDRRGE